MEEERTVVMRVEPRPRRTKRSRAIRLDLGTVWWSAHYWTLVLAGMLAGFFIGALSSDEAFGGWIFIVPVVGAMATMLASVDRKNHHPISTAFAGTLIIVVTMLSMVFGRYLV